MDINKNNFVSFGNGKIRVIGNLTEVAQTALTKNTSALKKFGGKTTDVFIEVKHGDRFTPDFLNSISQDCRFNGPPQSAVIPDTGKLIVSVKKAPEKVKGLFNRVKSFLKREWNDLMNPPSIKTIKGEKNFESQLVAKAQESFKQL